MKRSRTKVAVCLLAVLLAGHFVPCQAVEAHKRSRRLWWASVALVVAASVLDVASSRGGVETNPLMRGRNGNFNTGRAVMLKSIAMGGMVATEALVLRRSPMSARGAAVANFATAGTITGLAIRNLKVPRAEPASR
jgi:hypothetical protein